MTYITLSTERCITLFRAVIVQCSTECRAVDTSIDHGYSLESNTNVQGGEGLGGEQGE